MSISYKRISSITILAGLLALPSMVVVAAASQPGAGHSIRRAATFGTLTVSITQTSGTVWGKVSIKPINKSCSKSKCTFKHVKVGTKLTLTEKATNSTTWPFSEWKVNGKKTGTGTSIKVKMGKKTSVGAVYVLPATGGTLKINITDTGTVWGKIKVEPLGVTCNSGSCTYKNVTIGENLTVTETPTNSSTWPFGGWSLNGADKGTGATLQFAMATADTIDANYCDGSC